VVLVQALIGDAVADPLQITLAALGIARVHAELIGRQRIAIGSRSRPCPSQASPC
jgi:hypothetical protein